MTTNPTQDPKDSQKHAGEAHRSGVSHHSESLKAQPGDDDYLPPEAYATQFDHPPVPSEDTRSPRLPKEAAQIITQLEQIQGEHYGDFTVDTCEDAINLITRYHSHAEKLAEALKLWQKAFADPVPIGGGIANHFAIENAIEKSKSALAVWQKEAK